jgi:membrane-associated protein
MGGGPETLQWWLDMVLHLDDKLEKLINDYGVWTHLILFAVIFCETGLVVMPFLPGDSLLFAAGVFAARGALRLEWLIPLLIVAAIFGDTVNYWLGRWIGERAFSGAIPFLKKKHFEKTHGYFEKFGGKTIIIARFVPIVRTFAPFVAGIGAMNYRQFFAYNIIGGIVWVLICLLAGFWFGGLKIVKDHFELVVLAIILLSLAPVAFELCCHYRASRKQTFEEPKAEQLNDV